MIIYLLLTHFDKSNKIMLSDKMINSLKNQTNNEFRVLLGINNCKDEDFIPYIRNLDGIIHFDTNNISIARNKLIESALSLYSDDDYIINIDGDDELTTDATEILLKAYQLNENIYACNFYSLIDGKFSPTINCNTSDLGFDFRFNNYLIKIKEIKDKLIFYFNTNSCEDMILGFRLVLMYHEVSIIKDPIQYYHLDLTEGVSWNQNKVKHNSHVRPEYSLLLSYLKLNLSFKIKNII